MLLLNIQLKQYLNEQGDYENGNSREDRLCVVRKYVQVKLFQQYGEDGRLAIRVGVLRIIFWIVKIGLDFVKQLVFRLGGGQIVLANLIRFLILLNKWMG